MKPIIGLTPSYDDNKDSIWLYQDYMNAIYDNGGIPMIIPFVDNMQDLRQIIEPLDGILFTGGKDIDPSLYNTAPIEELGPLCKKRDALEKELVHLAIELEKPILGICRGIQILNVVLGGTLYQDIPSEHPTNINHNQPGDKYKLWHDAYIYEPLTNVLNKDKIKVNSFHHQVIRDLAPVLKNMGISEDGFIEAVYMPDYPFLWAVQWHPERSYKTNDSSRILFETFIQQCK